MSTPTPLPGIKLFDLTGRTALITGGSKGLGYAMAAGLASAGAEVMLVSRNAAEADAAANQLARDFGRRNTSSSSPSPPVGRIVALMVSASVP